LVQYAICICTPEIQYANHNIPYTDPTPQVQHAAPGNTPAQKTPTPRRGFRVEKLPSRKYQYQYWKYFLGGLIFWGAGESGRTSHLGR
jgi:hypothetical protein